MLPPSRRQHCPSLPEGFLWPTEEARSVGSPCSWGASPGALSLGRANSNLPVCTPAVGMTVPRPTSLPSSLNLRLCLRLCFQDNPKGAPCRWSTTQRRRRQTAVPGADGRNCTEVSVREISQTQKGTRRRVLFTGSCKGRQNEYGAGSSSAMTLVWMLTGRGGSQDVAGVCLYMGGGGFPLV